MLPQLNFTTLVAAKNQSPNAFYLEKSICQFNTFYAVRLKDFASIPSSPEMHPNPMPSIKQSNRLTKKFYLFTPISLMNLKGYGNPICPRIGTWLRKSISPEHTPPIEFYVFQDDGKSYLVAEITYDQNEMLKSIAGKHIKFVCIY